MSRNPNSGKTPNYNGAFGGNFAALKPNHVIMQKSESLSEFSEDIKLLAYPEKAELIKRSLMLASVMAANAQMVGPEVDNICGEDGEPYTPLLWAYDLVCRCSEWVKEDELLDAKLEAAEKFEKQQAAAKAKKEAAKSEKKGGKA